MREMRQWKWPAPWWSAVAWGLGLWCALGAAPAHAVAQLSGAPAPTASATLRAALGQRIFFDARLSADGRVRCASCHQPDHAYSDPRPASIGVFGRHGTRNAPSLEDVTAYTHFFWDGRRSTLTQAVLDPFTNSVDLGLQNPAILLTRLRQADYAALFIRAFPSSARAVTLRHLSAVLVAFLTTLPHGQSAFDRFHDDGDRTALSAQALAGYRLFVGRAGCARCHQVSGHPATFTDNAFHTFWPGLRPLSARLDTLTAQVMRDSQAPAAVGTLADHDPVRSNLGRFLVTHAVHDVGAFRTPSLRNVALTAPYMHNGSIPTLAAAIDEELYYRGLQTGRPVALTAQERDQLLAFLESLSTPQSLRADDRTYSIGR